MELALDPGIQRWSATESYGPSEHVERQCHPWLGSVCVGGRTWTLKRIAKDIKTPEEMTKQASQPLASSMLQVASISEGQWPTVWSSQHSNQYKHQHCAPGSPDLKCHWWHVYHRIACHSVGGPVVKEPRRKHWYVSLQAVGKPTYLPWGASSHVVVTLWLPWLV